SEPTDIEVDEFSDWLNKHIPFAGMGCREPQITTAHSNTFQWVFEPTDINSRSPNLSKFAVWLQGDHPIFWISGKPGAGKSTLMKFISSSPTTAQLLEQEANTKVAFTASFYFWISGLALERSLEGLVRTLLSA